MKPYLRPVSIYNFTALLVLYVLVSAIVHLASSNSNVNLLAYTLLIFPIQVIFCVVFIIASIAASPNKTSVHFSPKALGAVFITQAGVLLMAPADCITTGKTAIICTSLMETLVKIKSPAFVKLDYVFYAFLVAYLVATIAFFKDAQIRKSRNPNSPIPLTPLKRGDRN